MKNLIFNVDKTINIMFIISIVFVLATFSSLVFFTLTPDISPQKKIKLPGLENFLPKEKEKFAIDYYEKFIKKDIFNLPKQIAKEEIKPAKVGKDTIFLDGIIWGGSSERSVAIVKNNLKERQEVKQGQVIWGWKISKIDKFGIVLVHENKVSVIKELKL